MELEQLQTDDDAKFKSFFSTIKQRLPEPKLGFVEILRPIYQPPSVSIFEAIYAWFYFTIQNDKQRLVTNAVEGKSSMTDLKTFIGNSIVRWVLQLGGAWFLQAGIKTDDITQVVISGLSILVALVMSILKSKKLLNMEPPQ